MNLRAQSPVISRLFVGILVGIVLRWFVQADGLEGALVVSLPSLFSLSGHPLERATLVFGSGLCTSILVISTITTIFNSTAGPLLIAVSFAVGCIVGLWVIKGKALSNRAHSASRTTYIPLLFAVGALVLLGQRILNLKDIGARWWVLAHASEDNAAWLNMLGRAGTRGSIGVLDVENLGHTLPSLMWVFRQVGDFVPGSSLLSPLLSDASQMAAGILIMEALFIVASVYLACAIVCSLCKRFVTTDSFIVAFLLNVPAAVGSLLGGLLLARFGYLSALAALVGAQSLIVVLIWVDATRRPTWIALTAVFTGLSWFPIIPIVGVGVIWEIMRLVRQRGSTLRLPYLHLAALTLSLLNIVLHLQQILRRYPDVDRLQGSIWIGSQTLVTFLVVLALTASVVAWYFLPRQEIIHLIVATSIASGWLALVWFNDLLRTGGPAHYGTTKLTFIVMYMMLPLLLGLVATAVLRISGNGTSWLPALALASIASLGVTSLSNDLNNVWPRNPSEGERSQDAIAGILPLIQEAASSGSRAVVCMFVGDFEATGKWAGSYNCTRWGSSLAGVDGPNNEIFRQTILGNGIPEDNIKLLIERDFFRGVSIVTDNPERLAQLNPWGVITEARKSGGSYVVFRPSPTTYRISELTP